MTKSKMTFVKNYLPKVDSMERMQKIMEEHAETISKSGHKQETTVVKILSV